MLIVTVVGWLVAGLLLVWALWRKTPTPTEQQLQQVSRDYARARSGHRAQMDSIRLAIVAFEKADDFSDVAVVAFLKAMRDRTTERG